MGVLVIFLTLKQLPHEWVYEWNLFSILIRYALTLDRRLTLRRICSKIQSYFGQLRWNIFYRLRRVPTVDNTFTYIQSVSSINHITLSPTAYLLFLLFCS